MHSAIRLSWLARFPQLDRYAMGLSGLCAVHCFASAVLVALASTVGGMLLNPAFHEIGLTVAIILGALALGRGIFEHGYMAPAVTGSLGLGMMAGAMQLPHGNGGETLWTLIGVAILALGHDLNRRAAH